MYATRKLILICLLMLGFAVAFAPRSASAQDPLPSVRPTPPLQVPRTRAPASTNPLYSPQYLGLVPVKPVEQLPAKNPEQPTVKSYQIKGDVKTASKLIQTIIKDPGSIRMESDVQTKRLIVVGSQESHRIIAAALVNFDTPVEPEKPLIKVFQLKYISAKDAFKALSSLSRKKLMLSSDPRTNSIVVSGSKADAQLVYDLLEIFDVDAKNAGKKREAERGACNIRVSWLVDPSSMVADDVKLLRKVPKHCDKVLDRLLEEDYLTDAALMTEIQSLTVDDGGSEFRNMSFRNNLESIPEAKLQVDGTVRRLDDGRYSVRLKVGLESLGTEYKFGSDFEVKAGHAVAFSLSDFNGVPSVWVIQLTPVDSQ